MSTGELVLALVVIGGVVEAGGVTVAGLSVVR